MDDKKKTSSVRNASDPNDPSVFGTRLLVDRDAVYNHNAWDNVEWDEEHEKYISEQLSKHLDSPMPPEEQEKINSYAAEHWNRFYERNENRFFKDRHWLRIEFPELFKIAEEEGPRVVLEVGCGAGNTLFPLLAECQKPDLFVHACDYSSVAVDVVKSHPEYDTRRSRAIVWDLTSTSLPEGVNPASIDVIVLIFVFSALRPEEWEQALINLEKLLKPGGLILFRDYGRHDLAQLRFKQGRMMQENFYVRGDGTRVYFFTPDEIQKLFSSRFTIEQNAVDRRLIVNRSRKLKMYRVWLQGKFKKPIHDS
ncbi:uncharacterized protein VTP21DRAFT_10133 [Calcarisporiella thermophila]|uniref:uncharacterized protein n=1 Tax=Calcarisporiella thermophila TaxID=911321 RepID=UPI003743AF16